MQNAPYYKKISPETKALDFNLKELWSYRDLIVLFVRRDFVSKYKQTILGPAWAIVQPLLTTIVFTFIFGNIAGLADCPGVPAFLFYMCANIAWQYFAGCLTGVSNTFLGHRHIMGKVYFPRLVIPVSTLLTNLIAFAIQSLMFIVFLVIYLFVPSFSVAPTWMAFLTPVVIIQLALLAMGCGVIIAACTTKYRDLQMLVSFGVTLWLFATPIAYSLDVFSAHPVIMALLNLNPVTPAIEILRCGWLGVTAGSVSWLYFGISWVITLVVLVIGVLLFNKVAKSFLDTV